MVAENPQKNFSVTLRVWRQPGPGQPGRFVEYPAKDLNPHMSFLELLDVVNDELTLRGEEPIAFDHDCREEHLQHPARWSSTASRTARTGASPATRPICAVLRGRADVIFRRAVSRPRLSRHQGPGH